jgi:hypothetical protein
MHALQHCCQIPDHKPQPRRENSILRHHLVQLQRQRPRSPSDDGCMPSFQLPISSFCDQSFIYAGGIFSVLNLPGTAAATTSACEQLCLVTASCLTFSFADGTCTFYSQSAVDLDVSGFSFPCEPGRRRQRTVI